MDITIILEQLKHIDLSLRIFLGFVVLVVTLVIIANTIKFIVNKIKKFFRNFYMKYKDYSQRRFNTILLEHLIRKIKTTNKFLVLCTFSLNDSHQNQLEIMTSFAQAFSNYFNVSIKYDKNSLILIFDDFYSTINPVINQLFTVKKSREKQYNGLKIFMSITEIEEDSKYLEQLKILRHINNLTLSKNLICNSSFKFYYCTVKPQNYIISSNGDYLFNHEVHEIFTVDLPVHTL